MTDKPVFADNDTPMDVLVKLSRYFGTDPDFIVAGGGNTSVKNDKTLWVKASGFSLATIGPEGFVEMSRAKLDALLASDLGSDVSVREEKYKTGVMDARTDPQSGLRPSVECVLHNLMPSKYVVHTHPAHANAITCMVGGEKLAAEMFGDDAIWIDYVDPGYTLARKIYDELKAWQNRSGKDVPEAIFMENHGLVISGDTPDEIFRRTGRVVSSVMEKIRTAFKAEPFGKVTKLPAEQAQSLKTKVESAIRKALPGKAVVFNGSEKIMMLAGASGGAQIAAVGPLCPDQIVYCKSFAMWVDAAPGEDAAEVEKLLCHTVEAHKEKTGFDPYIILVSRLGMFAVESGEKSAATAAEMYAGIIETMAYAEMLGGIQPMDDPSRKFIEQWEVESYRKKMAES